MRSCTQTYGIKFDGIIGLISMYRLRYNLIVFIYCQRPVKHNIKISQSFTVILNFNSRIFASWPLSCAIAEKSKKMIAVLSVDDFKKDVTRFRNSGSPQRSFDYYRDNYYRNISLSINSIHYCEKKVFNSNQSKTKLFS